MTPRRETGRAAEQADLPGLALTDAIARADQFVDCREKQYTAERLLVSHPDTYAIASRLFFEIGLSKRAVCDCCKLSSRTLNALIEREMRVRGAEVLYENVRRKKSMIVYEIMEQLEDLVNDEEAVREAGIGGLIQAVRMLQGEDGKPKPHEPSVSDSPKAAAIEAETIEYAQIYRMSRSAKPTNGLEGEENLSPRAVGTDEVVEGVLDATSVDSRSLLVSDNSAQIKEFANCVAKSSPKSGGGSGNGNDGRPPVVSDAPHPGAGGTGGVPRAPLHPKMHSQERNER